MSPAVVAQWLAVNNPMEAVRVRLSSRQGEEHLDFFNIYADSLGLVSLSCAVCTARTKLLAHVRDPMSPFRQNQSLTIDDT